MGLFSSLGTLFGGAGAAEDIARQERKIIGREEGEQARLDALNAPYTSRGVEGLNAFADMAMSGPGELSEPEQAFLDNALRGVEGRFSAMGLADSGAHRNALADAFMRTSGLEAEQVGRIRP